MKNFIEELKWRGMYHQSVDGIETELNKGMAVGYIGFDPTADSLGIGNMVQIMTLLHFQKCGHKPIALVGGATGMVGDPSGKSAERNLLDEETLNYNIACQRVQLEQFLDFDCGENSAEIVNNYDWFKDFGFLDFIRDVGKHITVNYMKAKDSVKKRIDGDNKEGMSFTEFTYQLVQGYDFYHLWKNHNCLLQLGGSDQWGNITTGTEMIKRLGGGKGYAVTTPLITKSDGTKFGKTEEGNLWLDGKKTSPYAFYQFWLGASDDDAPGYIRIFSTQSKEELDALEATHQQDPARRILQNALADEITERVHGKTALELAKEASGILFKKEARKADFERLPDDLLDAVFKDVPQTTIPRDVVTSGTAIIDFLSDHTGFLRSKGEARRALKENSVSLNKKKVNDGYTVSEEDLVKGRFVFIQRGKKKQFIVNVE